MVDASHVRHKWFRTTNVALVVSIQYDCKWKLKECKSFFHKSKLKCRIQSKSIAGRQFFILAIEGTFGHSFHFFNFIYQHVHSKPQTYTHTLHLFSLENIQLSHHLFWPKITFLSFFLWLSFSFFLCCSLSRFWYISIVLHVCFWQQTSEILYNASPASIVFPNTHMYIYVCVVCTFNSIYLIFYI